MERFITQNLLDWKNHPNRKPLIIRGARQVGKTWAVKNFGEECFAGKIHVIDLEKHPDWHIVFDKNLDVKRIISELELFLNERIEPGRDLLFFDEIQSCPRAIMALRYFYEDLPELHVIAAGSLQEFVSQDIPFPVGRVQFLNMYPMAFAEFLIAAGKSKIAEQVLSAPQQFSNAVHQMVLDELRQYFLVGGMPECVKIYRQTGKLKTVFEVQAQLNDTFRQDFSKYAPFADKRCLRTVLMNSAKSVGQQIKYSRLAEGFTSPTNKKALELLLLARLASKVPAASPSGLPFGASASSKRFKVLMLDIGLMQQLCRINASEALAEKNLLSIYRGALAEQFVGQEFLAAGRSELYYWSREAKSSTAEVDFLLAKDGKIFPVEVKSGPAGKLKSMHLLLKTYSEIPTGYVLSGADYAELPAQKLAFLPLYYAYQLAK